MVAGVVTVALLMAVLDTTIVNVALDTLSHDLGVGLGTIQWVSTGYLLSLAAVIPLSGWVTERFGSKPAWIASIALFAAGSGLCALATTAEELIAFRVLQGLGGGMLLPIGFTLIAQRAGPQQVGRALAIIGVPVLLAPIFGPIIGGLIVDDAAWQWLFVVNLPIAVAAIVVAAVALERDAGRDNAGRLDVVGAALLCPGLVGVVFGLSEIESRGGIADPRVLVPIAGGLVLLGLFAWHGLRVARPLIELRLFRSPGCSTACRPRSANASRLLWRAPSDTRSSGRSRWLPWRSSRPSRCSAPSAHLGGLPSIHRDRVSRDSHRASERGGRRRPSGRARDRSHHTQPGAPMISSARISVPATVAVVGLSAFGIGACGGGSAATPAPPETSGGRAATVGVESDGTLGKVLVDSRGRTIYLFQKDAGSKSECVSACASAWPPVRATGKPVAGPGLTASKLGTAARSDGRPQVTYNDHPLYRYTGDRKPGDTNGQGLSAFGAAWFTVSGSGNVVSRPTSKPSGGGY